MKKLSILIPIYNEEKTVSLILEKIKKVKLSRSIEKEIIIIDDCSTDRSKEKIANYCSSNTALNIKYYLQTINEGKGAALQKGISEATGDYIIIQDADLEYDPKDYNTLLKPVLNGLADVVYGSRFKGGKPHRVLFFWHSIGNKFLTFVSNAFTDLNLTDMETCYKLFRSDIIKNVKLEEKRFGFEPEITSKISRIPHIRIFEVGISYYGRTYSEGKKIGWKDGFRALYCIIKYNVLPNK